MTKNICFCLEIHIPAVPANYRFFDIHRHHNYFSEEQVKRYVNKISNENIIPFFEFVWRFFLHSNGRFKLAVSISGITLTLLRKHAPRVVDQLEEMRRCNCIEFLSVSWSHSIFSPVDQDFLAQQVRLHDEAMLSVFGNLPGVFLSHSPATTFQMIRNVLNNGKKAVFTFANIFENQIIAPPNNSQLISKKGVYMMNHHYSRLLQDIDLCVSHIPEENIVSTVYKKMQKDFHKLNPLITIYNPVACMQSFHLNRAKSWEEFILQLLGENDIQFVFPSELIKNYSSFIPVEDHQNGTLRDFILPDFWLNNDLQKKAFKKQMQLNAHIQEESVDILKDWIFLLDMDYLYYMNMHFTENSFAENHFSPFSSPYLAYINYMNIMDDMEGRFNKKPGKNRKITKTNTVTTDQFQVQ